MRKDKEQDRQVAIQRGLAGESPESIWRSLGYSKQWFYKWLQRYLAGTDDWYRSRSCRPQSQPSKTSSHVEATVLAVRDRLRKEGIFFGAQAILWELEDLEISEPRQFVQSDASWSEMVKWCAGRGDTSQRARSIQALFQGMRVTFIRATLLARVT